ncbi:hypothetical protein, partial [Streptomyces sp. NPDC014894]|uniref:hypothetical protein n=1 Tax=unclassified Streptomyces TaxID=2593676 RepID=UPI0036FD9578
MSDIPVKRRATGRTARAAIAAVFVGGTLGLTPLGLTPSAAADTKASETKAPGTGAPSAPAGSEEHALERAKRTGEPVEVLSSRTEISETHAL